MNKNNYFLVSHNALDISTLFHTEIKALSFLSMFLNRMCLTLLRFCRINCDPTTNFPLHC